MRLVNAPSGIPAEAPDRREILVSGSAHMDRLMRERGLDPASPDAVMDEASKAGVLGAVAAMDRALEAWATEQGMALAHADALRAAAISIGLKLAALREVARALGVPVGQADDAVRSATRPIDRRIRPAGRPVPYRRPLGRRYDQPYRLDFRSASGKKLEGPHRRLIAAETRRGDGLGLAHWAFNSLQAMRAGDVARMRIDLQAAAGSATFGDLFAKAEIAAIAGETGIFKDFLIAADTAFRAGEDSMARWLAAMRRTPEAALFNNLGRPEVAGMAAALAGQGVATAFWCHGAMVAHGAGDRLQIASLLARAIYNAPNTMTEIWPRSRLQVRAAAETARINPPAAIDAPTLPEAAPDGPFRIFYAPNFLSWHDCIHGLSASCFETLAAMQALASAVKSDPALEVSIRIKTTAEDTARARDGKHAAASTSVRGLLPDDIAGIFDAANGVLDACSGSHARHMAACSLVATEGLTAVMFEALERRKPVLLLNAHRARTPSLPALPLRDLPRMTGRSAVYAASADDDLAALLPILALRHVGHPLTNAELEAYLWT